MWLDIDKSKQMYAYKLFILEAITHLVLNLATVTTCQDPCYIECQIGFTAEQGF